MTFEQLSHGVKAFGHDNFILLGAVPTVSYPNLKRLNGGCSTRCRQAEVTARGLRTVLRTS